VPKLFARVLRGESARWLPKAMDAIASKMKDPKDILLVDLDNQGKWKIVCKDEVDRISRS
jgi:hypothetical protein